MHEDNSSDDYHVVMHLIRWERTRIAFSLWERISLLWKGEYRLNDLVSHDSVGWVPVFERLSDAVAYRDEVGPGAQIMPVARRFEEP